MSAIMYEPAQLRDSDGLVHYSYGDPTLRTTLCETTKKGRVDTIYAMEELRIMRGPVTCFLCLRRKGLRWPEGS